MAIGKSIVGAAVLAGIVTTSVYLGRNSAVDPNYRVERQDGEVYLNDFQNDTSYRLVPLEDQLYLGTVDHQLQGAASMQANGLEGLSQEPNETEGIGIVDATLDAIAKTIYNTVQDFE